MKKLNNYVSSILISAFFAALIPLIINILIGSKQLYFTPMGNNMSDVLFQYSLTLSIGLVSAILIDLTSLLKNINEQFKILIHIATLGVYIILVGYMCHWFMNIQMIIIFFIIFVLVYAFFYFINYQILKKEINETNKKLRAE